jgi:hypothetical protein
MAGSTLLDSVANDLALWLDQESTRIAAAMAPQGVAPFAADLSEEQKLQYYRDMLFNPDGSPNLQGRNQEMQRLGPQSFTMVYKAVVKAYPSLRLPTPPGGVDIATQAGPPPLGEPAPPPGLPRGMTSPSVPQIVPIIPHMAGGGIVTQPTVALIGEAGPEAVVPLPNYQPPDPDLQAHLGGTNPAAPQPGEIQQYIDQAARQRGIDPEVAMSVAYMEGGRDPSKPDQPAFTDPAVRGTFPTGSSWWPFQLHYGGQGYDQYGNVAGMGNDFTRQTGYQPGDPAAWRASVDFALDQALKNGWYPGWYGSKPAGVSAWQGIPRSTR